MDFSIGYPGYIYISKNRDDLVIVTVSGITCTVETAYIPQNKTCFDDWWNLCNNRLGCWRSSKVLWFLNSFPSISGLEASLRWYSATFSSKLIDVAVSRSWSRRASKKSAYSPTRSFSWSCLVGDFCTDSMVNPVNHHEKPAFGEYEKKNPRTLYKQIREFGWDFTKERWGFFQAPYAKSKFSPCFCGFSRTPRCTPTEPLRSRNFWRAPTGEVNRRVWVMAKPPTLRQKNEMDDF